MSTVVIKRSARRAAPEIPTGEIAVEPPPEVPQTTGGRWQQAMMALPMLGGSVAMAMMMGQGRSGPYGYVIGGLFGVSSIAMLTTSFGAGGSPKKAEMMAARREYLRHLAGLRRRVRETATRQRVGMLYRHPDPNQLWSTAGSFRGGGRRPADRGRLPGVGAPPGRPRLRRGPARGRAADAGHPADPAGAPAAGRARAD